MGVEFLGIWRKKGVKISLVILKFLHKKTKAVEALVFLLFLCYFIFAIQHNLGQIHNKTIGFLAHLNYVQR